MSEVQVNEKGGGGKAKQKKQILRVDFTPMVDMNMLLITFFMFCTTLLKPQVMNIGMPSQEKAEVPNKIRESTALTVIMGANGNIYYYEGMPSDELYKDTSFLKTTTYKQDGLRQILLRKNEGTYQKVQELKVQLSSSKIEQVLFDSLVKQIQTDANETLKIAPNVLIKPTDKSSYKNMVDVLDEMLVCNIGYYQIVELSEGDRYLVYQKTGNDSYLSEQQKKDVSSNKK
ncbi:MAG: biopolymer transporter ExbD [Prevotellaceae bacterium]|jgi:biopolymer transport protein ExbD|nr:biopolymer transporter ExbD [Prevotellaceae bacterium]